MCGIAGIWNLDGPPVRRADLKSMADQLAHRGPDGEGYFLDGPLGLAHRRLSIIDLSHDADQPMSTPDGRLVLTFNGEIHNYIELRKALEQEGVAFRSHSDTEVILHAYDHWGTECFDRFNGMWALAIWDRDQRRLLLSRDRFGIKPLFYLARNDRFAFASEIKALLEIFQEERTPNLDELRTFLLGGAPDSGEETFFQNIRAVPPAVFQYVNAEGLQPARRYWSFKPGSIQTRKDAGERFRELFTDAVRLRLRSDVPVGTCLSGGLDSTAVVRTIASLRGGPIHCFSLRYPRDPCDESRFSAAAADDPERYHVHWVEPPSANLLDGLRRIVRHHDAPTPSRGRYPQGFLFEEAARHVTVVLDGQGADELMAGYDRFTIPYFLDRLRDRRWRGLSRDMLQLSSVLSGSLLRNYLTVCLSPLRRRLGLPPKQSAAFLHPDFRGGRTSVPLDRFFNTWAGGETQLPFKSHLNNALWTEFTRTGAPEMLHSGDALGMAFSLESRPPFFDHRLVEFCFTLPYDLKIRDGWTKYLQREALRSVLPDAIRLRRDKTGFPAPLARYMRAPENLATIRELLLDPICRKRNLLNARFIERLLEQMQNPARPFRQSETLWRCITTELWFQQYID